MASLGNPRSWIPYMNGKDCSQGFCSLNCPQWCNVVHPPPPPFEYLDENDSRPNFSPLVIAIIGILATAFLLVSYYAIISKYCGRRENQDHPNDDELQEDIPSLHEPWHASTIGLDESLIKSITVCKYKRGDGLVQVTDCSVCLSEFQDDESVRLLPKCSHAFHLPCIDTWLKSHSTCPLCRATIFPFNASAPHQVPAMVMELPSRDETSSENGNAAVGSGNEIGVVEEEESIHGTPPSPPPPPPPRGASKPPSFRAFSDLGSMQGRHRIIEIRDDELEEYESIGRSVSMGHSFQSGGVSVAHVVVHMNQEQHSQAEGCSSTEAGPSKRSRGESSKWSYKREVLLHCVLSPIAMKRSFSSGRFSLSTSHRARQGIVPVAV